MDLSQLEKQKMASHAEYLSQLDGAFLAVDSDMVRLRASVGRLEELVNVRDWNTALDTSLDAMRSHLDGLRRDILSKDSKKLAAGKS